MYNPPLPTLHHSYRRIHAHFGGMTFELLRPQLMMTPQLTFRVRKERHIFTQLMFGYLMKVGMRMTLIVTTMKIMLLNELKH